MTLYLTRDSNNNFHIWSEKPMLVNGKWHPSAGDYASYALVNPKFLTEEFKMTFPYNKAMVFIELKQLEESISSVEISRENPKYTLQSIALNQKKKYK